MTIGQLIERTYHHEIGIPSRLAYPRSGLRLRFSKHAINAAREDGLHQLPVSLPLGFQLIETTELSGVVVKWVVRFPWVNGQDLVLVVRPNGQVKSMWVNSKEDTHVTLRKDKYVVPTETVR